ncbi:hypothetical protein [Streptomyces sp. 3211]|uniref:hypothetical protein n=1 Tax=Streptomyces sp. 3211 TaxID=1964449 RepID=UPI00202AFA36|nr:hypothetical protein [Streptomyces sp. 3211]
MESGNARIRRAVKARGHFQNETTALKCVHMAITSLDPRAGAGRLGRALEHCPEHLRQPPSSRPRHTAPLTDQPKDLKTPAPRRHRSEEGGRNKDPERAPGTTAGRPARPPARRRHLTVAYDLAKEQPSARS